MKRVMLMGETGAGKSALIRSLSGRKTSCSRAMAVEFCGPYVNTPGEFLENRRFYPALITVSVDCDILLLVQDATRRSCLFPPKFAVMFNRRVIGVVSKADAAGANVQRAERFLEQAGVREIVRLSVETGSGLDTLRDRLH